MHRAQPAMTTCGKWDQVYLEFWDPYWKSHRRRSIPLQIPPPQTPLQIPSKCTGTPPPWTPVSATATPSTPGPSVDPTWVPRSPTEHPMDTWVPYSSAPTQMPGSPMEHTPWTPGSPTDLPSALTPVSPTYPPTPTGCWGSSESPPADTLHIPHLHLYVCLSFPYGLRVSGIPPTSPHCFYTGPSWGQWARIQEEG